MRYLPTSRRLRVLALAVTFGLGCSFSGNGDKNGGGTGSSGGAGGAGGLQTGLDGSAWADGNGAGDTTLSADGPNCGLSSFGLDRIPPDLLIVQDRSGSMGRDSIPCGTATCTKWNAITSAMNEVVAATDSTIRWGLTVYPANNTNNCGAATGAVVPIGNNNATLIASELAQRTPNNGGTPTRWAMDNAVTYMQSLTDTNPKYLLLATDGLPTCLNGDGSPTGDDTTEAEKAVKRAADAGFQTFVVGIAVASDQNAVNALNTMAVNGGRARSGDPKYYPVTNSQDLIDVLNTIGGQIAGCSFTLSQSPPDSSNVAVDADANRVPKDTSHANGWDYGAGMKSIELYGTWCDDVKSGAIKNVQAIFGCPGEPIP